MNKHNNLKETIPSLKETMSNTQRNTRVHNTDRALTLAWSHATLFCGLQLTSNIEKNDGVA